MSGAAPRSPSWPTRPEGQGGCAHHTATTTSLCPIYDLSGRSILYLNLWHIYLFSSDSKILAELLEKSNAMVGIFGVSLKGHSWKDVHMMKIMTIVTRLMMSWMWVSMIGGGWFKGQEVGAEGCPLQGWPEFAHFASLALIHLGWASSQQRIKTWYNYKSIDGDDDGVKKHGLKMMVPMMMITRFAAREKMTAQVKIILMKMVMVVVTGNFV